MSEFVARERITVDVDRTSDEELIQRALSATAHMKPTVASRVIGLDASAVGKWRNGKRTRMNRRVRTALNDFLSHAGPSDGCWHKIPPRIRRPVSRVSVQEKTATIPAGVQR